MWWHFVNNTLFCVLGIGSHLLLICVVYAVFFERSGDWRITWCSAFPLCFVNEFQNCSIQSEYPVLSASFCSLLLYSKRADEWAQKSTTCFTMHSDSKRICFVINSDFSCKTNSANSFQPCCLIKIRAHNHFHFWKAIAYAL